MPDGVVSVRVGGREIAEISIVKGHGKLDLESSSGGLIPELTAGQRVQVLVDSHVAFEGDLVLD